MKRILVVLFIVGFVYVDHISGPLLPNDWYCILRAGTVSPETYTCEHKSLWTGWTRNEATDKLNKLIKEWEGKENKYFDDENFLTIPLMEYVWNPLSILAHLKVQQVSIVGNLHFKSVTFFASASGSARLAADAQ